MQTQRDTNDPVGCAVHLRCCSKCTHTQSHGVSKMQPAQGRGPGTHLIGVEIEVEIELDKRRGHDGEAKGRHYSTTVG